MTASVCYVFDTLDMANYDVPSELGVRSHKLAAVTPPFLLLVLSNVNRRRVRDGNAAVQSN
jgi:hypothetical protein